MEFNLRQDLTTIFCEVDDFCQIFERQLAKIPQLPGAAEKKTGRSRLGLSEIMTIAIAFPLSGYHTFKDYYTKLVLPSWSSAFPKLVSYSRFIELMPLCVMPLCCFLHTRRGENTGISFIDSTHIEVCHPCRSKSHRVFENLVGWGKNSMGWHYGFKLHLVISERGELLAFKLTPGNVDDRTPVPELTEDLLGKLFGDRGYISKSLFDELYERGLKLITKPKKNMKPKLIEMMDKILLRKRALIESVNDLLKNILQIEHTRHRSVWNFLVNLLAALAAYTYLPSKPSLDLEDKGLLAFPSVCL